MVELLLLSLLFALLFLSLCFDFRLSNEATINFGLTFSSGLCDFLVHIFQSKRRLLLLAILTLLSSLCKCGLKFRFFLDCLLCWHIVNSFSLLCDGLVLLQFLCFKLFFLFPTALKLCFNFASCLLLKVFSLSLHLCDSFFLSSSNLCLSNTIFLSSYFLLSSETRFFASAFFILLKCFLLGTFIFLLSSY